MTVFDLLIAYIQKGHIRLKRQAADLRATYHDPCNYGRRSQKRFGHGYFDEPRWIMDRCFADWVELYPNRNHQTCCGGGGGALTSGYNEERVYYGRRKMEQIRTTGADLVVMPCHSCHGQISNIKETYGMADLGVKYLWEAVADCLVIDPAA